MIIKLYIAAAAIKAKIMRPNAFLAGKSNSSAACGTASKPTKAHGAMATIEMIAAKEVFPVTKTGSKFAILVLDCNPTTSVIKTTPTTIKQAKTNCILPDKPVPFTLKYPKMASMPTAMTISGKYTSHPATEYK